MTTTPQPAERALAEALRTLHSWDCGQPAAKFNDALAVLDAFFAARTQEPTEGARRDERCAQSGLCRSDHERGYIRHPFREGARSEVGGLRAALDEAVGRLVGVAATIAQVNHDGSLDPRHPYFWPDLDAAIVAVEQARAALAASESASADPRVIVGPGDPDEWGRRFDVAMDEED